MHYVCVSCILVTQVFCWRRTKKLIKRNDNNNSNHSKYKNMRAICLSMFVCACLCLCLSFCVPVCLYICVHQTSTISHTFRQIIHCKAFLFHANFSLKVLINSRNHYIPHHITQEKAKYFNAAPKNQAIRIIVIRGSSRKKIHIPVKFLSKI